MLTLESLFQSQKSHLFSTESIIFIPNRGINQEENRDILEALSPFSHTTEEEAEHFALEDLMTMH